MQIYVYIRLHIHIYIRMIHTYICNMHIASWHTALQRQIPPKNATSPPGHEIVGFQPEKASSSATSLLRNAFMDPTNLKPQHTTSQPQVHRLCLFYVSLIYVYIPTCIHSYGTCIHECMHIRACIRVYIYIYIHTYTSTRTHTHTHKHTHT